jgi:hypothetical protein
MRPGHCLALIKTSAQADDESSGASRASEGLHNGPFAARIPTGHQMTVQFTTSKSRPSHRKTSMPHRSLPPRLACLAAGTQGRAGGAANLYVAPRRRMELRCKRLVRHFALAVKARQPDAVSLSCGRPVMPVEIPGWFSSSSLPPSFARGRRTTAFFPATDGGRA